MKRFISASLATLGLATFAACGSGSDALSAKEIQEEVGAATVRITVDLPKAVCEGLSGKCQAGGTGFIVNAEKGLIVTNQHVVAGAQGVRVDIPGEGSQQARVLGEAACDDMAVIQLSNPIEEGAELEWAEEAPAVGDEVTALGYPGQIGSTQKRPLVVTQGNVNVEDEAVTLDTSSPTYQHVIQHNADINHGHSGGPLVNDQGEVVGINSLTAEGEAQSGAHYAITADHATNLFPGLVKNQDKDYLGIDVISINSLVLAGELNKGDLPPGLYVTGVEAGSPADQKLFVGDLILEINGQTASRYETVCDTLQGVASGDTVRFYGINFDIEEEFTEDIKVK